MENAIKSKYINSQKTFEAENLILLLGTNIYKKAKARNIEKNYSKASIC